MAFQQSTVVPQTPLHTARVLQEDRDHWDEVKVGERRLVSLQVPGFWEKRPMVMATQSPPAPYLGHRVSPGLHQRSHHGTRRCTAPSWAGRPAHSLTQRALAEPVL